MTTQVLLSPTDQLQGMLAFWKLRHVEVDGLKDVLPPPAQVRKPRLIVVPRLRSPLVFLYEKLAQFMSVRPIGIKDESQIKHWQRDPNKGPYAIWIDASPEPVVGKKQLSGNGYIASGEAMTTVVEELVLHLYCATTGERVGRKVICYCAGSLNQDPSKKSEGLMVPLVDRRVGDLIVNWYDADRVPFANDYGVRSVYPATW
jgi:hypothetical protein